MDQIHYISGRIFISHELLKYKLSNIILVIGAGDRWRWRSVTRRYSDLPIYHFIIKDFIFKDLIFKDFIIKDFFFKDFILKDSPQNNFQGFYFQRF